jgi:amidohydrolase
MRYREILDRAAGLKQTIIDFRREFHRHPEIALQEFETAKRIAEILKGLGIETRMLVQGRGVLGRLKGRSPGKTVALRADTDALPVREELKVPYQSQTPGAMHACGHDAHMAMLLGAAMILGERRKDPKGEIVFIFQPAEETGEGAKQMIEEGALDGVDGIFALHVSSILDSGTVGCHAGPIMAAGDFFDVTITGKGGHGGLPHLAVDPIVIAAQAISTLQTVVSREMDPVESAVISICKMKAGEKAYNIIPDSAAFGGTIRSLTPEWREYLPKRMREILDGIVRGMRGTYEFNLMERFPLTVNDVRMTDHVRKVAEDILGKEKVFDIKPLMGSEDVSYYLQQVPGSFFFLGTRNAEKGIVHPHHHPCFDIDEEALSTGVALNAALALEYLNHND